MMNDKKGAAIFVLLLFGVVFLSVMAFSETVQNKIYESMTNVTHFVDRPSLKRDSESSIGRSSMFNDGFHITNFSSGIKSKKRNSVSSNLKSAVHKERSVREQL